MNWISVRDRLPEDQVEVLVATRSKKWSAKYRQRVSGNRPLYPSWTCRGYSLDAIARTTEGGKMKRVIAITILTLLTLALCGCGKAEAGTYRLRTLETGALYTIYVDNLTGIQYLKTYQGGMCVMVDAEGRPLIWEGEK